VKHPWFKKSSNILGPFLSILSTKIPRCPAPEGSEQFLEDAYNLGFQSFSIITLVCATLYFLVIRAYIQARYLNILAEIASIANI